MKKDHEAVKKALDKRLDTIARSLPQTQKHCAEEFKMMTERRDDFGAIVKLLN